MKYFTPNFYFKKVTQYSEKITRKTKNFTPYNKTFTPNLFFFFFFASPNDRNFTQNVKILHQLEVFYTKLMALSGFRSFLYFFFSLKENHDVMKERIT